MDPKCLRRIGRKGKDQNEKFLSKDFNIEHTHTHKHTDTKGFSIYTKRMRGQILGSNEGDKVLLHVQGIILDSQKTY